MWPPWVNLRDDRGVLHRRRWSPAAAARDPTLTADQRRNQNDYALLVRADHIAHSRWTLLLVWAFAVNVCISNYSLVWLTNRGADCFTLYLLGTAAVFHGGIRWHIRPRVRAQLAKAAMLVPPRCRACGYLLDGLTTEADGCRVCPECGAAWRVPDPAASHTTAS
ncbi:MAG: hypothetical protein ACKVS8_02885 [Phycisphaerales bacterium]